MCTTSTPLLAIFLITLVSVNASAQGLVLSVKGVRDSSNIKLTFNNTILKTDGPLQTINPKIPKWNFKIVSNGNTFTVKTDTELNIDLSAQSTFRIRVLSGNDVFYLVDPNGDANTR